MSQHLGKRPRCVVYDAATQSATCRGCRESREVSRTVYASARGPLALMEYLDELEQAHIEQGCNVSAAIQDTLTFKGHTPIQLHQPFGHRPSR